jgi:hypothetical protein
MTRSDLELAAKVIGSVGLVVMGMGLSRLSARAGWAPDRTERVAWLVWLVTRPGVFGLLFVVLALPVTSDAAVLYLPQGLATLSGQLPHRDFSSSYGPFFPYAVGLLLSIVAKPETLVLSAIVFEGLALFAWPRAVAASVSERARADGQLLYACSPLAVWTTSVAGQNQSWLCFLFALAFAALARKRLAGSALWMVLGACAVKALALVPLPYLVLCSAREGRLRWLKVTLAIGVSGAVLLAPFVLQGAEPWRALSIEGRRTTSGNLPFLLGAFGLRPSHPPLSLLLQVVLLAAVVGASVWAARRSAAGRAPAHHAALCLVMLVLMLASKKAYTMYLALFWLPLCFVVAAQGVSRGVALAFGALNVVAAIEPGLWLDWLRNVPLTRALAQLPVRDAAYAAKLAVFLLCELVLLTGYAWLLRKAARALVPSAAEVSS